MRPPSQPISQWLPIRKHRGNPVIDLPQWGVRLIITLVGKYSLVPTELFLLLWENVREESGTLNMPTMGLENSSRIC